MRALSVLAVVAGASALTSTAMAADAIRPYEPPPPVVIVEEEPEDRVDVYIGVFAGFKWGTADCVDDPEEFDCLGDFDIPGNVIEMEGWLVGVNAGVNFMLGDGDGGLFIGVVGDIAWNNVTGSVDTDFDPVEILTQEINWQGSVRGKLGIDAGMIRPYLTAGIAFAGAERFCEDGFNCNEGAENFHTGLTAGVGVDVELTDAVFGTLEARWTHYKGEEYDTGGVPPTIEMTTFQITAGINFAL